MRTTGIKFYTAPLRLWLTLKRRQSAWNWVRQKEVWCNINQLNLRLKWHHIYRHRWINHGENASSTGFHDYKAARLMVHFKKLKCIIILHSTYVMKPTRKGYSLRNSFKNYSLNIYQLFIFLKNCTNMFILKAFISAKLRPIHSFELYYIKRDNI